MSGFMGAIMGAMFSPESQVVENIGGRYWDRTSDPCDVNTVASPQSRAFPRNLDENGPVSFDLGSPVSWAYHGRL